MTNYAIVYVLYISCIFSSFLLCCNRSAFVICVIKNYLLTYLLRVSLLRRKIMHYSVHDKHICCNRRQSEVGSIAACIVLLCRKEASMLTLRSRYSSMYIPSDFFHASVSWSDAFPLHRPFKLGRPCQFHVMDKEVEAPDRKLLESLLDPHDADHTFSAKVLVE